MINKQMAFLALDEDSPYTNSFLFTLDRLPLLLLLYAKTRTSAVQKRHSKVYENPIAPSFNSILLVINYKFCQITNSKFKISMNYTIMG